MCALCKFESLQKGESGIKQADSSQARSYCIIEIKVLLTFQFDRITFGSVYFTGDILAATELAGAIVPAVEDSVSWHDAI